MKTINEALETMMPAFLPRGPETLDLRLSSTGNHDLLDRCLCQPLTARLDLPHFSNSAMDGFAVRAEDTTQATPDHPVTLPLAGEIQAGATEPAPLLPHTAQRIFTGAPVPPGADAIVMQENTHHDCKLVHILESARLGRHIRHQGEDLKAGEVAFEAGVPIDPAAIALLLGQGVSHIETHRRPRIAILPTGDELCDPGSSLRPGQIINTNGPMLACQVRQAGGIPVVLPAARDALDDVVAKVVCGLEYDALITIGGVSVGDYDFVGRAFEQLNIVPAFWKVRIRPGKPVLFGTHITKSRPEGSPVIGLPGNPVSAMVTFEVFVRPGIRRMLGDEKPFPSLLPVRMATGRTHTVGRTELVRTQLTRDASGLLAHPRSNQGSGAVPSMVCTDALVIVPASQCNVHAGDKMLALPMPPGRGEESIPAAYE